MSEVRPGLMASAGQLAASAVGLAEAKLLLFANELECERIWTLRLLLRASIALTAMALSAAFAGTLVAVLLWDLSRVGALLAPAAIFCGGGLAAWRQFGILAAAKPPAFAETLAALRKDREALAACGKPGHA